MANLPEGETLTFVAAVIRHRAVGGTDSPVVMKISHDRDTALKDAWELFYVWCGIDSCYEHMVKDDLLDKGMFRITDATVFIGTSHDTLGKRRESIHAAQQYGLNYDIYKPHVAQRHALATPQT